jgi:acyl-CoA reductase-like NAD-dependent aldehyde dehydrogenase
MKKLASILILVFAFTLTAQGQKKGMERENGPKLTVEQQTDLAIKKMTLGLDLTEKQQSQIKPLISTQAAARIKAMQTRKEHKEANKKPSSDEIYAMKSNQLDNQIAFKSKMKEILNKEQFEKFEKMKNGRKEKGKKMMMRKKQSEKEKR